MTRAWGGQWASYDNKSWSKRPNTSYSYSGANAYLLMYRKVIKVIKKTISSIPSSPVSALKSLNPRFLQVEKSRNTKFPEEDEVPQHIKDEVKKEEQRAIKER